MKKQQKLEISKKTPLQLLQQLEQLQKELTQAKLALFANKLEDTSKIRRISDDIALVRTIITQKETQNIQEQLNAQDELKKTEKSKTKKK